MLIDIMPKSLSMFTSSYRGTVSCSRLHRRMKLVHAKRPPRQRLSPRRPPGNYSIRGHNICRRPTSTERDWPVISADAHIEVGFGNEKSLIEQLSGLGHFPGRELYKMPVIRTSGSKLSIVFRHTIPSSENRLRSESRVLSSSGSIEARTLSGQRRAALCRTNVTALQEMVKGRAH